MADTVVDPRAMMVHLEDTEVALAAVMGSGRLPCFLACALFAVFVFNVFAHERCFHSLRNAAWVRKRSS